MLLCQCVPDMQKICRYCLESFSTDYYRTMYCSQDCRQASRLQYLREYSAKERREDSIGRNQYQQAMRALRAEKAAKQQMISCIICGTEYQPRQCNIRSRKSLGCSAACRALHRRAKLANARREKAGLDALPVKEMLEHLESRPCVEKQCVECGEYYTPVSFETQHLTLVCSPRCREKRKKRKKRVEHQEIACTICAKTFIARNTRQKRCSSPKCRLEHNKRAMAKRRLEKPHICLTKEEKKKRREERMQQDREKRREKFRQNFGIRKPI